MKKDKNIELIGATHFNASRDKWELEFWEREDLGFEINEKRSEIKIKYFKNKKEAESFANENKIKI